MCCRVSPKQKQEIVRLVKVAVSYLLLKKPYVITLAIGDGANDVNMITEAHVGVGIKGVEGQQAARSADFAIGEFKLVKRLMFWHGREYYRKNSNLVLFIFYKNVLLNMPNVFFGYFSWYSGSKIYDEVGYQLFNILYTSTPIVAYALFDKSTSDVVLMKDPKYYEIGPRRLMFNIYRLIIWFSWATIEGFLIYLLA